MNIETMEWYVKENKWKYDYTDAYDNLYDIDIDQEKKPQFV